MTHPAILSPLTRPETTVRIQHLLMLDVDDTLVSSGRAEGILFPLACQQALGISEVSADWASYRCPTDRGIVRELVESRLAREATVDDYRRVEENFERLLEQRLSAEPDLCQPVAGALEAMTRFRQLPDTVVAIATAGWYLSARYKLETAGFDVAGIPFATSRDAETKADIMRVSAERATASARIQRFASITYMGDSTGDLRAAEHLNFRFIAIDTRGRLASAKHRYPSFEALDDILRTVKEMRDTLSLH